MNWRKRNPATVAMLLTWAATSSSPACALISAAVETLRLSLDKVAVLADDGCKQGIKEAQAVAHGRLGSPHLTSGLGKVTSGFELGQGVQLGKVTLGFKLKEG